MALHAARVIRQRHKAEAEMNDTELSEQAKIELREAFEAADKNGDGILSADEYHDIFQSHGLAIDREWIERTIARNDKDGDGGISLEEFIEMNTKSRLARAGSRASDAGIRATTTLDKAKLAFNAYDRNRDGYLTKAELRKTSKTMTDAQIDAVFEKYDKNKDGKLEFDEFKEMMETNSRNKAAAAAATATVAAMALKKGPALKNAALAAASANRRKSSGNPEATKASGSTEVPTTSSTGTAATGNPSTEDRRKSSGPASRGESIDKVLDGGGDEDQPQSTSIQPTTATERPSGSSKSTPESPTKIATTDTTTPDGNH